MNFKKDNRRRQILCLEQTIGVRCQATTSTLYRISHRVHRAIVPNHTIQSYQMTLHTRTVRTPPSIHQCAYLSLTTPPHESPTYLKLSLTEGRGGEKKE